MIQEHREGTSNTVLVESMITPRFRIPPEHVDANASIIYKTLDLVNNCQDFNPVALLKRKTRTRSTER